jgi:hypothetical protein
MNRPYSLDYARLASGAFYETIFLVTFYEITNLSFAPFLKTGAEGRAFEPVRKIRFPEKRSIFFYFDKASLPGLPKPRLNQEKQGKGARGRQPHAQTPALTPPPQPRIFSLPFYGLVLYLYPIPPRRQMDIEPEYGRKYRRCVWPF